MIDPTRARYPARPPSQLGNLPGLRAMRSPGFRTALAAVLLVIGLGFTALALARQAGDPDGQFGIDFADFIAAARRLDDTGSPYAAEMLGGPVEAQGLDRYRYPPLYAQALRPLSGLAADHATLAWLAIQAAAVYAALWIGSGLGGAVRSLERALWCGVAAAYYLPVFDTLWKGNVSGILALASVVVGVGGTIAGLGAAGGALLKAVPGTLVPVALAAGPRSRRVVLLAIGAGVVLGAALAPQAWLDYPGVVLNMLGGSADYASNLAPSIMAERAGWPYPLAAALRLGSLLLVAACIVLSVLLARSREGLPAAAYMGTLAMLLLPGAIWYHYLVVLLPFAAVAWPRASVRSRFLLLCAAALISVSLAWLPLALIGAVLLSCLTLIVIWPACATGRRWWRPRARP